MKEVGTVRCDIVGKPLVQVQVLATRGQSGNIQSKCERLAVEQVIQNLEWSSEKLGVIHTHY